MRTALQRDIAARAGVSPATVSKVLAGTWQAARITAGTAHRVEAVAQTLGYRPVLSARSTRTGRTGTICLLVDPQQQRSALPRPLLDGLQRAATAADLRLLYAQIDDDGLNAELRVRACDAWLVNYHGRLPDALAPALAATGQPTVWLGRADRQDAFAGDEAGATRALVARLAAAGHRRIAFVAPGLRGDEQALAPAFRARLAGWRAGLAAAGIAEPILLSRAPGSHVALRDWLRTALDRADAFLLYDAAPYLLAGFAAACADRTAGEWPALACVCAREACAGLPILTATLPWREIGAAAVAQLVLRLDGGAPLPPRQFAPSLEEPVP